MANYIKQYIDAIETGEIVVSNYIRLLYCQHLKPIIEGKDPRWYFNEKKGSKFIKFAEGFCRQSKGDWNGKTLQLCLFQKAKYQAIFGILDRETHLRRFKEVLDVRARKNGKSTENAALGLYLELFEDPGAEIYSASPSYAQSKRILEEAVSMKNKDPELSKIMSSRMYPVYEISVPERDSYFRALSNNPKALDGLNASCAIVDEIHELKREIYDILKQSTSTRSQPLVSMITTAGFVREALFDDMFSYAIKVLNGAIDDPGFLPLLYVLDDPNEINDESCWIKANPSLGEIKSVDYLRSEVAHMQGDENYAATVKVKDFNIVGVSNITWLDGETIRNDEKYSEEELKRFDNSTVIGGYDLSRTGDLTAFTTLLFDCDKCKVIAITQYWATMKFLESEVAKASKVPWNAWIERGLLRVSDMGGLINYHDIANYILEMFQKHGWTYGKICYDSYSAGYLVKEINDLGWSEDMCQEAVAQGFKTLSIPMQEMKAMLANKTLVYQNNPITKWMLANIQLVVDRNGNLMPKKAEDGRANKIDGPATILNALVEFCRNRGSYLPNYESKVSEEGGN